MSSGSSTFAYDRYSGQPYETKWLLCYGSNGDSDGHDRWIDNDSYPDYDYLDTDNPAIA